MPRHRGGPVPVDIDELRATAALGLMRQAITGDSSPVSDDPDLATIVEAERADLVGRGWRIPAPRT